MKKLLVVAVLIGLAAVVYAKVFRSSPTAQSVCTNLGKLCGNKLDKNDIAECANDVEEARDIFGDKVIEKADDCIDDADTCMEAIGCMGGAATHALDELEQGFERGRQ